jgi:tryptophanyl-tRNA synthetase
VAAVAVTCCSSRPTVGDQAEQHLTVLATAMVCCRPWRHRAVHPVSGVVRHPWPAQTASGRALSGLLLTYPVHQAADILFCKADLVPVGKDQLPHVELTRVIARRFAERYAPVFPVPEPMVTDNPEIPGLDGRKMSKSRGNAIALGMTADETADLIRRTRTDSERRITFEPERRPGVSGLLSTAALCTGRTAEEVADEIGDGGSGLLKKVTTEAVNTYLAAHRARRAVLASDPGLVDDVLRRGNAGANAIAEATLDEVRDAMGMRYLT